MMVNHGPRHGGQPVLAPGRGRRGCAGRPRRVDNTLSCVYSLLRYFFVIHCSYFVLYFFIVRCLCVLLLFSLR